MPEMNGFEVIESLRAEDWSRKIPIIVITGQVLTEEDMRRLNSGFTTILSKGVFNAEETMKHVEQTLERRRLNLPDIRQRVLQVVAYIHAHFAESISRSELASLVGLSERHLDRSFQLEMGVTPITYLNRFRVRQARIMLESGDLAITEVALNVGFSNSGYFTRVFRDEVGVSPRNYARSFCSVKRSEV
jgi:transcriptional regulator GlxA family with amidase domain